MLMAIRISTAIRSCLLLAISVIFADVYFLLLRESLLPNNAAPGTITTATNSAHHYGLDHVVEQARQESRLDIKDVFQQQQESPGEDTAASAATTTATAKGKERVLQILARAGYSNLDDITIAKLPTWQQVVELLSSDGPVIYNKESCQTFQERVPAVQRMLGAAGMFSTGTNLVTVLLKANCQIPERVERYGANATKEQFGIRWQVPWGKHTPAHYRNQHSTEQAKAIAKTDILPIVMIRNPWHWMQSMCKNPYTARWNHHSICPNLVQEQEESANVEDNRSQFDWNPVQVKYGAGTESYQSLVHLWKDWYAEYLHANSIENTDDMDEYPFLMVRMEDVIFHTEETITAICDCAGGIVKQPFHYEQQSAKRDSPGHDISTGYLQAWIRYSQPLQLQAGFTLADYHAARHALDDDDQEDELLKIFRYKHPAST